MAEGTAHSHREISWRADRKGNLDHTRTCCDGRTILVARRILDGATSRVSPWVHFSSLAMQPDAVAWGAGKNRKGQHQIVIELSAQLELVSLFGGHRAPPGRNFLVEGGRPSSPARSAPCPQSLTSPPPGHRKMALSFHSWTEARA